MAGEHGGRRRHDLAEPAQQRGPSGEAGQRIVCRDLEARDERRFGHAHQRIGIDPQRVGRIGGKGAVGEHREACQRQPLGAADPLAALRITVAPLRPGARVDQHADDRQIERCACPFAGVAPRG